MGRGIVHEPDDIRPGNPPSNPALLAYLQNELVKSGYDLRHLYRLILNSQTYQRSSISSALNPEAEALFAHYPVRRLDAEVLIDGLTWLFGPQEDYSSAIPEPYTYIPRSHRTITLADGSITNAYLELFGRPARDTGLMSERRNELTGNQRAYLVNASHVQNKIRLSWRIDSMIKDAGEDKRKLVTTLYAYILSRPPTEEEHLRLEKHSRYGALGWRGGVDDLAWALVNSKEFLYRH
jgi:hypothetical protein